MKGDGVALGTTWKASAIEGVCANVVVGDSLYLSLTLAGGRGTHFLRLSLPSFRKPWKHNIDSGCQVLWRMLCTTLSSICTNEGGGGGREEIELPFALGCAGLSIVTVCAHGGASFDLRSDVAFASGWAGLSRIDGGGAASALMA
jgi:hypothetical protein